MVEREEAAVWDILEPVLREGQTYTLPQTWTREAALDYWVAAEHAVFVAEDAVAGVIGTYYLKANQKGGGDHVANCGYMTHAQAAGRGVARAMCAHSLAQASESGFSAMQFNFVVSTNKRAVRLWQSLGFAIVGTLPAAFRHPQLGAVNAYVMHRFLSAPAHHTRG